MRKSLLVIGVAVVLSAAVIVFTYRLGAHSSAVAASATAGQASAPSELDRLLAAIALYPDPLLAQMLLSAGDPPKIVALNRWLKDQTVKGTELQDAAVSAGFDPSFVALALFPQVVTMMDAQLEWTVRLGKAFAADRAAVFDSIQRLRKQAQSSGALKTTPQQEVQTQTTSSGQQVIVIEPANPQVVYVPQYNAQTVYTQPTTTTQTVIIEKESSSDAAVAGLIGFTAGIAIGAAVNNSYYYGPYGWHGGASMYNDAWDDYYDHREDAREDWQDHREDIADERGDRAGTQQQQRTDRQQTRQETRPESQAQREQRRTDAQAAAPQTAQREQRNPNAQSATAQAGKNYEARGYSQDRAAAQQRSGTRSDAFSGYSNGRSESSASSRGGSSRGSSRGGGRRR